jgi:hypothetical protein
MEMRSLSRADVRSAQERERTGQVDAGDSRIEVRRELRQHSGVHIVGRFGVFLLDTVAVHQRRVVRHLFLQPVHTTQAVR